MNTVTSTEFTPNQTLYDTNTRSQLTLLNDTAEYPLEDRQFLRQMIRKDVAEVIDFANARFKVVFDSNHKPMTFNTEDKVYLRLHHEYSLSEKDNSKLFNQRVGPFVIKRKIGNAAYELKLSSTSRVHSVISIAQLKSASGPDPFNRPRPTNLGTIHMKGDTSTKKSYEVKKILKRRTRKYEKIAVIEYLIK